MPTIETSFRDLENLVGKKLPSEIEKLNELLQYANSEVEKLDGDALSISLEDKNRPDLWCVEGLARCLRLHLGLNIKEYSAKSSGQKVLVNSRLKDIRPFIACCIVKNLKLTDEIIKQLMQQQLKIDTTYGRNRKKTSIGLYDLDKIKFPLKYTTTKPEENAFVPLGFSTKISPADILDLHPKGKEYGHLLHGFREYPFFVDADGKVLSMPPIINSNDLGQVTESTKNILIEVTGNDWRAVNNVLVLMALSLADRAGELYSVEINYPYRNTEHTPIFGTKKQAINLKEMNEWLGTEFSADETSRLLSKAGHSACSEEGRLSIGIPCYRSDIMHPVDLYEDVAIAYGFGKLEPAELKLASTGGLAGIEKLSNKFRDLCCGFGAQEVLNFTLTNKDILFKKMNLPEEEIIELENPQTELFTCLRNSLLPGVLDFLSRNTTKKYPQRIFEAGDVVVPNKDSEVGSDTIRKLCFAIADAETSFTEAKQILEGLVAGVGRNIEVLETEHPSFIPGRCGVILYNKEEVGIIGEVHPIVLSNFGIETPVVVVEFNLGKL
jgi:phenylalanyl-tRNA synthetase beta chain